MMLLLFVLLRLDPTLHQCTWVNECTIKLTVDNLKISAMFFTSSKVKNIIIKHDGSSGHLGDLHFAFLDRSFMQLLHGRG